MKYSIIIPVYNSEKELRRSVSSVLEQSYSDVEVILIDDGSKDNSLMIMNELAAEDTRVKTVSLGKNMGVSAARNAGLLQASGDWIGFLDSDDYLSKDMLSEINNGLECCTDAEFVVFGLIEEKVTDGKSPYKPSDKKCDDISVIEGEHLLNQLFDSSVRGFVCNKLFSNDIIKKYGISFNEDVFLNEDILFCFRYFRHVKSGFNIKRDYYHYQQRAGSSSRTVLADKHFTFMKAYKYMLDINHSENLRKTIKVSYAEMILTLTKRAFLYGVSSKEYVYQLKNELKKMRYDSDVDWSERLLSKAKILFYCPIVYRLIRVEKK